MRTHPLSDDDRVEVLPMLPSLSIAESRDFYRDFLGFDEIVYEDRDYLILRRDFLDSPLEVHFWLTDERHLCENSGIYIRGGGIDALHAEFTKRETPKLTPMTVRPWNMEEFYVWDPHGNILKFGRIPGK
ncbi:VOC family protein [Rhizobium sp. KVB221]|uniref:VOC family protein n=1 Tax=Rhizobium setariae TaxID=2801340 RepID=A0A937CRH2_9HYPH|nr:VOC family protein [Rhizobium setariae]MBL0374542.1 VOC family protein [Rhizobium setariae]